MRLFTRGLTAIIILGSLVYCVLLIIRSQQKDTAKRTTQRTRNSEIKGVTILPKTDIDGDTQAPNHSVSFRIVDGDARPHLLRKFLSRYSSPMTEYADFLVAQADKNGFDYRLVTAIAMCESNVGNRMPTKDSYNAFGISVYTGQKEGAKFKNWEHSISWVSDYIKKRYYDQGLVDLIDIGKRWAPPSVETGNSWAVCVQNFIDRIV